MTKLLFESRHTCSICRLEDKDVQVHHIDGDPTNNKEENLIVLCLNCHSKVSRTGGLGRGYSIEELRLYKKEWINYCRADTFKEVSKIDENRICFVLMPFREPFNSYYEQIITKAIVNSGLLPLRSDEIFGTKSIVEDIYYYIKKSIVVIAELTTKNPNVLYELGLAHAIGKPVILITQNIDDVPFDLKHLRCIVYNTISPIWANELQANIEKAIQATIADVENKNLYPSIGLSIKDIKTNVLKSLSNLLFEEEIEEVLQYWRGYFLMDFHDFSEAISMFERYLKTHPKDDVTMYQIACCHAKLKDKDNMIQYLKSAINLNKENKNEAIHDEDFKEYWEDEDFKDLTC
ncbi:MAG: hypothetical protein AYK19_04680 [Theionarchaea archaeon DG-70-1]|nr:MAG: hypothetical protein AYK19_04680 [Theionarchaea archaeon DG-70-1]